MSRRDEGALAGLEREAGIVPENAKLALEMSRVYSRLGDREKAHSQAENAVRWRATESRIPESLRHEGGNNRGDWRTAR